MVLGPPELLAQCGDELVEAGVVAYQELRLDAAVESLLRARVSQGNGAGCVEETRTLMYLGAAEFFRGDPDAATSTFRELTAHDPTFRPDTLVFPPTVTEFYREVQRENPVVEARIPTETELRPGAGSLPILIRTSVSQRLRVEITRDDRRVRRLYEGDVLDSLTLAWDGRFAGVRADAGIHTLRVSSLSDAEVRGVTDVLLDIRALTPTPPPRAGRVGAGAGDAAGSVMAGIMVVAAAYLLPSLLGGDAAESSAVGATRVGIATVGGALAVAGAFDHLREGPVPIAARSERTLLIRRVDGPGSPTRTPLERGGAGG
jgi:hypothetical protein